jgi:hypothetical protein
LLQTFKLIVKYKEMEYKKISDEIINSLSQLAKSKGLEVEDDSNGETQIILSWDRALILKTWGSLEDVDIFYRTRTDTAKGYSDVIRIQGEDIVKFVINLIRIHSEMR